MTPELSRIAKMLIDAEGISDVEADARLRAMTLEIVVGDGVHCSNYSGWMDAELQNLKALGLQPPS